MSQPLALKELSDELTTVHDAGACSRTMSADPSVEL
jgi:hypothetical protein